MSTYPVLVTGFLCLALLAPLSAQDSRPAEPAPTPAPASAATPGSVFAAAREAGGLPVGTRRDFFRGKNPGVALVEHKFKVTKQAMESVFVEHGTDGTFVRSTYQLDLEGQLQAVTIEHGTRSSFPDATETTRYQRKDQALVHLAEGKQPQRESVEVPGNALPMSVAMFLLPTLNKHLPARVEFVPLFEVRVHTAAMVLTYAERKTGGEFGIEADGESVLTGHVDAKGRLTRIDAPGGNEIKPVPAMEAEALLAKLRPA